MPLLRGNAGVFTASSIHFIEDKNDEKNDSKTRSEKPVRCTLEVELKAVYLYRFRGENNCCNSWPY